ncbi:hypothetical protein HY989_03395 [Candidatus Micrarchaeota archaeon]|nr:hypothetical protein [Candidatus Micrarchaeota archaeon]
MVELSFILSQVWLIFLISLVTTFVIFPLIFLMTFFYEYLERKYEKSPKVLLMLITAFVGVFIAVSLIEIYLEFTLPFALAP